MRIVITIGVLAALAGCGSIVNGGPSGTPGNQASVTSSGATGSSPADVEVTVTEADDGSLVRLHVGQRLRVLLGGRGDQWHRPASSEPSLRLTTASGGYPTGHPADAIFVGVEAGTASITSITDHPCLHAHPPCKIAQRVWSVHVHVAGTR